MLIGTPGKASDTGYDGKNKDSVKKGGPPFNRPTDVVESRDRAFNEAVKQDALAPRPSGMDDWEPQPDGSMRNRKTGISLVVRNPCPPGDIEHEFALAAYNRSRSRR